MRKAILALLVIISLWGATSWHPAQQQQWQAVQSIILEHQGQPIQQKTIFYPRAPGFYRATMYVSAGPNSSSVWNINFSWTDATGLAQSVNINAQGGATTGSLIVPFIPAAGEAVSYSVSPQGLGGNCNFVLTIEQFE